MVWFWHSPAPVAKTEAKSYLLSRIKDSKLPQRDHLQRAARNQRLPRWHENTAGVPIGRAAELLKSAQQTKENEKFEHVTREAQYFRKIYGATVDRKLLRLLHDASRPTVALRIRHASWIVSHGELASFSISAAQKMVRRGFDNLFFPNLVAVGLFTAFVDSTDYKIELHLIVTGASKIKVARAFKDARAEHVASIRGAIEDMLNGTPEVPIASGQWTTVRPYSKRVEPNSEQWREYIDWLKIHFRSLVFRYGCDRYWNRLRKEPRLLKAKVKKKHEYPFWLEPYWFGGSFWDNKNIDRSRPKRIGCAGPDYFNLEDDDE